MSDIITIKSDKEIGKIDLQKPYFNNGNIFIYNDYLEFTQKWIKKCFTLSKNEGRFLLNIPLDKNKGGQKSVGADITKIAKDVGWKYHSTIIWNEGNISRRTAWGSWKFNGQRKKGAGGHPAPFPIELPRRCIKLFSFVGDTVLDPFLGSGSTLIASYLYGRNGIGIDIDKSYCDIAVERLRNEARINQNNFL